MQERYTYAVARVRAMEAGLLNQAALEQLLACKSHDEALRTLQEKGWGSEDCHSAEEMLAAETDKTWAFLNSVINDPHAFDLFRYEVDFHNVKAAIKQVCTEHEAPNVFRFGGTLPAKDILAKVQEQQFAGLPNHLAAPAKEAFEIFLQTRDGQLCDLVLDKACLDAIAARGKKEENEAMRLYAETTVAAADIRIAARACKTRKPQDLIRRSLAECSSLSAASLAKAASESLDALCGYLQNTAYAEAAPLLKTSPGAFECWCDSLLIKRLKPQLYNPFTIGPLAAYLLARESEIKSVRLILSAKRNGLPDEAVRERLRECYV